MKRVVSFSGGRTSAYLCNVMLDLFGKDNVDFIYMDTGAEHPKTYEFIKKVDAFLGLDLVCLRGQFDQELGQGHTYEILDINELKCDLKPFNSLTKKYGTPTVSGAWCTSRMKEETHDKYCNDIYGKGNYETWLGIRADEPRRYLGDKLYAIAKTSGMSSEDMYALYLNVIRREVYDPFDGMFTSNHMQYTYSEICDLFLDRARTTYDKHIRYMAEITDAEKQDILNYWKEQPFDLEVDEHLGNCVFCVKKGPNKLALAARDEPELYEQFLNLIDTANPREDLTGKPPKEIMYRKKQSLIQIVSLYENHSRGEIAQTIRGMKSMDAGSCSESCEIFIQT